MLPKKMEQVYRIRVRGPGYDAGLCCNNEVNATKQENKPLLRQGKKKKNMSCGGTLGYGRKDETETVHDGVSRHVK